MISVETESALGDAYLGNRREKICFGVGKITLKPGAGFCMVPAETRL